MGKYQLDDKGKAQVQRFHEKQSQKLGRPANKKAALLEKMKKIQSQTK